MGLLRLQLLLQKDPLMVRRIIEPGEFLVAELRIELRPLKRKCVEKRGMAAELNAMPLRLGEQPLPDAAPAQILMHPEQVHEQPSGIAITDQPRTDGPGIVAHEET